jgi:prevent-host-death family protein
MKSVTATEAKNSFGELLMSAQSEPVSITRNGKEQVLLIPLWLCSFALSSLIRSN